MNFKRLTKNEVARVCAITISIILFYNVSLNKIEKSIINKTNRLPNILLANKSSRIALIERFILEKTRDKNEINIIIGDSQFYGKWISEKETFPSLVSDKDGEQVLNLSAIDARIEDIARILEILDSNQINIKSIVYNLNIAHYSQGNILQERILSHNETETSFIKMDKLGAIRMYYETYFNLPYKDKEVLQRKSFDWDEYWTNSSQLDTKLISTLNKIKTTSHRYIVVISPWNIESFLSTGLKVDKIKNSIKKYKELLDENEINTIEVQNDFSSHDFLDAAHFNSNGHRKMSDILTRRFYR